MTAVAAVAFTVLLVALAIFQIALIAGVPWGRAAWGGADEVLPASKRIGSIVAVVLYVAFAVLALIRAGLPLVECFDRTHQNPTKIKFSNRNCGGPNHVNAPSMAFDVCIPHYIGTNSAGDKRLFFIYRMNITNG